MKLTSVEGRSLEQPIIGWNAIIAFIKQYHKDRISKNMAQIYEDMILNDIASVTPQADEDADFRDIPTEPWRARFAKGCARYVRRALCCLSKSAQRTAGFIVYCGLYEIYTHWKAAVVSFAIFGVTALAVGIFVGLYKQWKGATPQGKFSAKSKYDPDVWRSVAQEDYRAGRDDAAAEWRMFHSKYSGGSRGTDVVHSSGPPATLENWFDAIERRASQFPSDQAHRLLTNIQHIKTVTNLKPGVLERFKTYHSAIVRLRTIDGCVMGIVIDPRTILTVGHLFPGHKPEYIEVTTGSSSTVLYSYELNRPHAGIDLIYIKIKDPSFPPLDDCGVRRHFNDQAKVPYNVVMIRPFSQSDVMLWKLETRASNSVTYGPYTMASKLYKSEALSVPGDSGSIVVDAGSGAILGFHVAAGDDRPEAYWWRIEKSELPPQETSVIAPQALFDTRPGLTPSNSCTIGRSKLKHWTPDTSVLQKSPLFGLPGLLPNDKFPAMLAKTGVIDPLKVGYDKIVNKGPLLIDEELMNEVAWEMAKDLPPPTLPLVLNHYQAMKGEGALGPLDMSKSAGPKYVNQNWHKKKDIPEATLIRDVNAIVAVLEQGGTYYPLAGDCLKDELRSKEKVDKGATRLFQPMDADFVVVWRKYYGPLFAAHVGNYDKTSIKIGINPHGIDWKVLYQKHRGYNQFGTISGDVVGFDFRYRSRILEIVRRCFEFWHEIHFKRHVPPDLYALAARVRAALWHTVNTTYVLTANMLYRIFEKLCSGHGGTGTINSAYQLAMFRVAFAFLVGIPQVRYKEIVASDANGDDGLHTPIPSFVEKFNQLTVSRFFLEYLEVEFLNSFKKPFDCPLAKWDTVTFLKRSFVNRSGWVDAPLDLQIMDTSIQWVRTNDPTEVYGLMTQKLRSYLHDLSHHDQDTYDGRMYKLECFCTAAGIKFPRMSYAEARSSRVSSYQFGD